jgi:hypothetical protein
MMKVLEPRFPQEAGTLRSLAIEELRFRGDDYLLHRAFQGFTIKSFVIQESI